MHKVNLVSAVFFILGLISAQTVAAQDFSLADVKGEYGFVANGTITITDSTTGEQLPIPLTSVGQFVASGEDSNQDGLGEATVTAIQNIGGFAILNLASTAEGSATYSVDPSTGLGVATVPVTTTALPELPLGLEGLPSGINPSDFAGTTEFQFRFVVTANGNLSMSGIKLLRIDPDDVTKKTPIGAFVTTGSASLQRIASTESGT